MTDHRQQEQPMPETRTAVRGTFLAVIAERLAARSQVPVQEAAPAPATLTSPGVVSDIAPDAVPQSAAPLSLAADAAPRSSTQATAPADPIWIAQACDGAGYPEMTVALLRRRASATEVKDELDRVSSISRTARAFGMPEMAGAAIRGGVGLETFREMVTTAKANSEAPIVTASTGAQAHAAGMPLNSTAIYDRLNKGGA